MARMVKRMVALLLAGLIARTKAIGSQGSR